MNTATVTFFCKLFLIRAIDGNVEGYKDDFSKDDGVTKPVPSLNLLAVVSQTGIESILQEYRTKSFFPTIGV